MHPATECYLCGKIDPAGHATAYIERVVDERWDTEDQQTVGFVCDACAAQLGAVDDAVVVDADDDGTAAADAHAHTLLFYRGF